MEPLRIENRVIPVDRVESYLNFMANLGEDSDNVSFGFPNSGIYHDLVDHYWSEFADALKGTTEVKEVHLPCIEPHGRSNDDWLPFWKRVGEALNEMPNLQKIAIERCGDTDWPAVCTLLGQLKTLPSLLLTFDEAEFSPVWVAGDVLRLADGLRGMEGLQELAIEGNLSFSEPLDAFWTAIESLDSLETIQWMAEISMMKILSENGDEGPKMRVSPEFLQTPYRLPANLKTLMLGPMNPDNSLAELIGRAIARSSSLNKYHQFLACYDDTFPFLRALGQNQSIKHVFLTGIRKEKLDFLATNASIEILKIQSIDTYSDLRASYFIKEQGSSLPDHSLDSEWIPSFCNALKQNRTLKYFTIQLFNLPPSHDYDYDLLVGALQQNYTLQSVTLEATRQEVTESNWLGTLKIIAELNTLGRSYMQIDPSNRSKTVRLLSEWSHSLDHLYLHLRENAGFILDENPRKRGFEG